MSRAVVNPFPAMGVAAPPPWITGGDYDDTINVLTADISEALALADEYVSSLSFMPARDRGILAISGDYGTGKTHLLSQVYDRLRTLSSDRIVPIYVEASGGAFVELHHSVAGRLDPDEIRKCVEAYYAEIVADAAGPLGIVAKPIVESLKIGEINPSKVVAILDLSASLLLDKLKARLRDVTNDDEFSAAMALLLRSGFDGAVSSWLEGRPPSTILSDRGISTVIDTDERALRSIRSMVLLYGQSKRRLVLAIDEVERVLGNALSPDLQIELKRLLRAFVSTGSLLILAGVPQFLHALPRDARALIGQMISLSGFNTVQVNEYIHSHVKRSFGASSLNPFTREVVEYLTGLCDGIPRHVTRMCHSAFQLAALEHTPITRDVVRTVARNQFGMIKHAEVRGEIQQLLSRHGWSYVIDHMAAGVSEDSPVDFLVASTNGSARCALVVVGSILDEDEARQASERVASIRSTRDACEVIIIVNGHTPETSRRSCRELGLRVLGFDEPLFTDTLIAAMRMLIP